jgi:hypothetical protein
MQIVKNRYAGYLLFVLGLLLFSSSITFFVLAGSKKVMAAESHFSDVPLDHPVYHMCRQLLQIGAIEPYYGTNLAPFEKISAEAWNRALKRIGEYLGRTVPESSLFYSDEEINGRAMLLRLQNLVDDSCESVATSNADNSRLTAFFMLERCLLAYDNE